MFRITTMDNDITDLVPLRTSVVKLETQVALMDQALSVSTPTPAKRGRPRTEPLPTPELKDYIIQRLSEGNFISVVCKEEGMPSPLELSRWRKADLQFAKDVEEARLMGCDVMAESTLAIADDGTNDTTLDEDGRVITNSDNAQRSKLRVWTRLELLKKMYPQKYGEKLDLNLGGQVGNPVKLIGTNMTQEEASNLYLEMLNKAI